MKIKITIIWMIIIISITFIVIKVEAQNNNPNHSKDPYAFVTQWGSLGDGDGQFGGISIAPDSTLVNHDAEFEGGGNTTTKITNYQDECYAILTTDPTNPGPRDIVVQAEYVPDPDKPWITPPEPVSCKVYVSDGLVFSDDFESYQTEVPYAELWGTMFPKWGYQPGSNDFGGVEGQNHIVGGNFAQLYAGTKVKYAPPSCGAPNHSRLKAGYDFTGEYNPVECRFSVNVGTEQLEKEFNACVGGIWYRGECGFESYAILRFTTVPGPPRSEYLLRRKPIGLFSWL